MVISIVIMVYNINKIKLVINQWIQQLFYLYLLLNNSTDYDLSNGDIYFNIDQYLYIKIVSYNLVIIIILSTVNNLEVSIYELINVYYKYSDRECYFINIWITLYLLIAIIFEFGVHIISIRNK